MSGQNVYVYGMVLADHPGDLSVLRGVGTPPAALFTVREARVAAVLSAAPARLRARRRSLLAHQDVLLALAEDGPVLPMRFGTVAADQETVRSQLADAAPEHRAVLDRVAGRVEFNLKAFPVEDALPTLVAEDQHVRRLRQELRRRPGYEANIRLGEAIAAGLARRASEAADGAVRELAQLADAVSPGPEVAGCVRNTSFLVERSRTPEVGEVVDRFAAAHRLRVELRLTGPLPCYSFVAPQGRSLPDLVPAGA